MTPEQLARLTRLRHDLHKIPEVSGSEEKTAAHIARYLSEHSPDALLTGLGGHGVAAVFRGAEDGPAVLIRCELDGLPITEQSAAPYRSIHSGRGHLCGHDGHMVMVAALADRLSQQRPACGQVVLLFQPAEETGKGAAAVIADPQFERIKPDYSFALHNYPGLARGQIAICTGPANCASCGMRLKLKGKTSHAAAPQDGRSPAGAMTRLMPSLVALGPGGDRTPDYALVTLTHAWLGEATFGIAPGEAEIWLTLRTVTDERMSVLVEAVTQEARRVCTDEGLECMVSFDDVFEACTNHPEAAEILTNAAKSNGYDPKVWQQPQPWSEDFGQFAKVSKSAMFWLGAGEGMPQLHNPDYDFPDEIIPVGSAVFAGVIDAILNETPKGNR
ncbi:amidohydrolase [Phycobacter sp. K97]|uniref:amidohydrolase n=1 Tax=Phycobacter sedimenti TaxID=3133977 RepID=UPI00311D6E93